MLCMSVHFPYPVEQSSLYLHMYQCKNVIGQKCSATVFTLCMYTALYAAPIIGGMCPLHTHEAKMIMSIYMIFKLFFLTYIHSA